MNDGDYIEITAKVKPEDAEYLAEWAGAVGCDVKDVAGASIEQFLEDWFNGKTDIDRSIEVKK